MLSSIGEAVVDTRLALRGAVKYSPCMNVVERTTTTIIAERMMTSITIIETIIHRPAVPVVRVDAQAT